MSKSWKSRENSISKGRNDQLLNAADYLSDNWELTGGFSILEILGELNKSCFNETLKTKAWLEWIQEQVGR